MKGLEALKSLVNKIPLVLIETNSMKYIEDIEKELKVLETIKKLHIFDSIKEWERYEKLDDETKSVITKEDYELLKEVLR